MAEKWVSIFLIVNLKIFDESDVMSISKKSEIEVNLEVNL